MNLIFDLFLTISKKMMKNKEIDIVEKVRKIQMNIKVCVGSSCHLKGSYEVIQSLKKYIEDNKLEDKVELEASFCLGNCSKGVSMQIDGEPIQNANPDTIEDIFNERVMNKCQSF